MLQGIRPHAREHSSPVWGLGVAVRVTDRSSSAAGDGNDNALSGDGTLLCVRFRVLVITASHDTTQLYISFTTAIFLYT